MAPLLFSVRIPTWLAILWRKCVRPLVRPRDKETPRSLIVFRLDQLGDVVLTTPLFRELKRRYPGVRCTVVVRPRYRELLSTNRSVDEVLVMRQVKSKWLPARLRYLLSAWRFYRIELRPRQFDLAISPRWDVDEDLATMLCVLTEAATRVGYASKGSLAKTRINRGFDAAFDVVVPAGPLRHEVDRNLAVVEALGGHVEERGLDIRLTEGDRKYATELLTHHDDDRMLVAVGIGGRAASRKWPLSNYAECVSRLNRQQPMQPVIVCSAEEDPEALELSAMLPVSPYILSGLPLRTVCAVLEACDLFIGNDSGAAHLAAAMDCAVVVVSRHPLNGAIDHPNSPVRFGPRCARYQVVQPLSGEGDCIASCRSAGPHCIKRVTVERVGRAINEVLPRKTPQVPEPFRDDIRLVGVACLV